MPPRPVAPEPRRWASYRGPVSPSEPFFAPLPPPPERLQDAPPVYPDLPFQVPMNVVGVPVALRLGLARSRDTLVVLSHAVVYQRGITLTVESWVRPGTELPEAGRSWEALRPRFGVLLDDGTKVGHDPLLGWQLQAGEVDGDAGAAPGLVQVDGSSSLLTTSTTWWLYPFPTGPRLDLVVAWADRGIPESLTTLDLAPMHSSAVLAEPLWPLPAPPEDVGWAGDGRPMGSQHPPTRGPGPDPADPGVPPVP